MAHESPKFPKPEFRAKKSLYSQGRNNVRISGIHNIAETPLMNMPKKSQRSQLATGNKENIPNRSIKKIVPPKITYHNKLIAAVPDTPLSNESWKSSCDASFLQKEKEINDEKLEELAEQKILKSISEVTPPASTPFKEYRDVQQFFHESIDTDNIYSYHDNTIMCFDNPPSYKENVREESVIVSLCDLLNKASVNNSIKKTNSEKSVVHSEVEHLTQMVNQTENYIELIENCISALNKVKESQITHSRYLKKMLKDKESADKTLIVTKESDLHNMITKNSEEELDNKPKARQTHSVIKSTTKSPSYKVPKKNFCLRKKVFCKSMPDVSNEAETPERSEMGNQALNMYMKMKEHMNFLSTPVSTRSLNVLDTPAVTSNNLQKQLDKLYAN